MGSPASLSPWPGATGYVAARYALRGLNEALYQDLAGTGVTTTHVVFGKVSSGYFQHNPGSEARIPKANQLSRTIPPEECARVIERLIDHPKREYCYPALIRWFFRFPALARWVGRETGFRH